MQSPQQDAATSLLVRLRAFRENALLEARLAAESETAAAPVADTEVEAHAQVCLV